MPTKKKSSQDIDSPRCQQSSAEQMYNAKVQVVALLDKCLNSHFLQASVHDQLTEEISKALALDIGSVVAASEELLEDGAAAERAAVASSIAATGATGAVSDEGVSSARRSKRTAANQSAINSRMNADEHNEVCEVCESGGDLLCCDTCSLVFHLKCIRPKLYAVPKGEWSCAHCILEGNAPGDKIEAKKATRSMNRLGEGLESDDERDDVGMRLSKTGELTISHVGKAYYVKRKQTQKKSNESEFASEKFSSLNGALNALKKLTWEEQQIGSGNNNKNKSNSSNCLRIARGPEKGASGASSGGLWCTHCLDDPNIMLCAFCGCKGCYSKADSHLLMLCDNCDRETHTYCMNPQLDTDERKKEAFYCGDCSTLPKTKLKKKITAAGVVSSSVSSVGVAAGKRARSDSVASVTLVEEASGKRRSGRARADSKFDDDEHPGKGKKYGGTAAAADYNEDTDEPKKNSSVHMIAKQAKFSVETAAEKKKANKPISIKDRVLLATKRREEEEAAAAAATAAREAKERARVTKEAAKNVSGAYYGAAAGADDEEPVRRGRGRPPGSTMKVVAATKLAKHAPVALTASSGRSSALAGKASGGANGGSKSITGAQKQQQQQQQQQALINTFGKGKATLLSMAHPSSMMTHSTHGGTTTGGRGGGHTPGASSTPRRQVPVVVGIDTALAHIESAATLNWSLQQSTGERYSDSTTGTGTSYFPGSTTRSEYTLGSERFIMEQIRKWAPIGDIEKAVEALTIKRDELINKIKEVEPDFEFVEPPAVDLDASNPLIPTPVAPSASVEVIDATADDVATAAAKKKKRKRNSASSSSGAVGAAIGKHKRKKAPPVKPDGAARKDEVDNNATTVAVGDCSGAAPSSSSSDSGIGPTANTEDDDADVRQENCAIGKAGKTKNSVDGDCDDSGSPLNVEDRDQDEDGNDDEEEEIGGNEDENNNYVTQNAEDEDDEDDDDDDIDHQDNGDEDGQQEDNIVNNQEEEEEEDIVDKDQSEENGDIDSHEEEGSVNNSHDENNYIEIGETQSGGDEEEKAEKEETGSNSGSGSGEDGSGSMEEEEEEEEEV